jgi:hypothetical protein
MPSIPGNDLNLGNLPGRDGTLKFSRKERDKHLYICGGTGTGKSKLLENLIRQDIKNWHKSKCGLIVFDPHGNLYDNLINWLAWNDKILDVPVIPIDLRKEDWIVSYNLLRRRQTAAPSVVVNSITSAVAHVAGQAGTKETPLFARWAGNVMSALYEKGLTLLEAEFLIDPEAGSVRHAMTSDLKSRASRQDWGFVETLSPRDFDLQISSTVNRLRTFLTNDIMRSMFGQPGASLDLRKAMDEGSIILVSLATAGGKVSPEDSQLFATLLLSDLWTAAQERGKYDGIKPFYLYLDEFQRFLTPTISDSLDEARGFGLHCTMAHQFPNQLPDRGEHGRRVYNSIMETASSKIVFRLSHSENLKVMAEWLFMGTMNPDEVKHQLFSTRVVDYREETREMRSESRSRSSGGGRQAGRASGAGGGGTENFEGEDIEADPLASSTSWSKFGSNSESENESWGESSSESTTFSSSLVPVLGKELSHVQFRTLEEQLFRAMAVLFDQKERHGVARLVGMSAPVSIVTPTVAKMPGSPERTKQYLDRCYSKLPFALHGAEALKLVRERTESFAREFLKAANAEVQNNRRRLT